MTKYASITVAIPTYERCQTVFQLVKSILPQLKPEDEILVINDGSADETAASLQELSKVRLISNLKNEGMVKTWNKCLTEATKDWICIIHDDDTVDPNALETIRKACALSPNPSIIGHQYVENSHDQSFRCQISEPGHWSAINPMVIPSGVTIHKAIVNKIGLFNEKFQYSADIEYFSRVSSQFTSILIQNPRILTFNLHHQNYEYKTWEEPDFFSQIEEIEALVAQYSGLSAEEAISHVNYKMNLYIKYILRNCSKSENKSLLRKVSERIKEKPYLWKKIKVMAYSAALFNWMPDL
jgi:glycosyltransferase involved in cell wall biosynthesis